MEIPRGRIDIKAIKSMFPLHEAVEDGEASQDLPILARVFGESSVRILDPIPMKNGVGFVRVYRGHTRHKEEVSENTLRFYGVSEFKNPQEQVIFMLDSDKKFSLRDGTEVSVDYHGCLYAEAVVMHGALAKLMRDEYRFDSRSDMEIGAILSAEAYASQHIPGILEERQDTLGN